MLACNYSSSSNRFCSRCTLCSLGHAHSRLALWVHELNCPWSSPLLYMEPHSCCIAKPQLLGRETKQKEKKNTYRKCSHELVDYICHMPKGHLKFLEKILEEIQVKDWSIVNNDLFGDKTSENDFRLVYHSKTFPKGKPKNLFSLITPWYD